ncbi:RNB domain-containing ribonuclease [Paraburkholderia aspalathi]|nr:RNB domain-containing ribonuclease [Paraburkholderia aspalathi]MBK3780032.1 RNB domain-containing ribonuclease [Paraburkholderia aspalathi]
MSAPFVTLDSLHTKDLDDAFRVSKNRDGYFVEVAIANAAHHVPDGSREDELARTTAATTYAAKRTITHMLPPHISEGEGSLLPGLRRPALLYEIELSCALEVVRFRLAVGTVKVGHRLSYELLSRVLEDRNHSAHQSVHTAFELSKLLLAKRRAAGALAFFDMRRLLVSSEEGRPLRFETSEQAAGYILVQELMVLVNREGAKYLVDHNIPAIYRNHVAKLASPPARDVAESVQLLLTSGAGDADQIEQAVGLIASVAEYGETVKGHYGLTLPAYSHLTSPLRRYADLVNQRQLVAHINSSNLPYGQAEIGEIARVINETIARQKRERKDSFKAALNDKAGRALDRARFNHLAEHEIVKAIELGSSVGQLAAPLVQELISRFLGGRETDRLVYSLLIVGLEQQLPHSLAKCCSMWLARSPGNASSFLSHATNVGRVLNFEIKTRTISLVPPLFEAVARACTKEDESNYMYASAVQQAKRPAEQHAAVRLLARLAKLPVPAESEETVPASPAQTVQGDSFETGGLSQDSVLNAKNLLVELHQKKRWPAPVYFAEAHGQAHRPTFRCTVTLQTATGEVKAEASDAPTKKQAEMLAAALLLKELDMLKRNSEPAPQETRVVSENPISALNEWTQSNKLPLPEYSFWSSKRDVPPFVCKVTIAGVRELTGCRRNTKREAKLGAAEAALRILRARQT